MMTKAVQVMDRQARRKGIPRIGSLFGNRMVVMVGEDTEGCTVVTLLCKQGHRSTVRLYGLLHMMRYHPRPPGCGYCRQDNGMPGKLTNEQARRILEQMEETERRKEKDWTR